MRRSDVLAVAVSITLLAGCDGDVQHSGDYILITSPGATNELSVRDDVSPAAGVQVDIHAATGLPAGELLTVSVITEIEAPAVWPVAAAVGPDGVALFEAVTIPNGEVILEVASDPELALTDYIAVNVVSEMACGLAVAEGPLEIEGYAPLRVLNSSIDSDPATPLFQAHLQVATQPGMDAQVHVIDLESGTEVVSELKAVGSEASAVFPVTLANGRQAVRATCTSPGGTVAEASATNTYFVASDQ